MGSMLRAIGMAAYSLVHPRMLWLAVWPFLVALVIWAALGYLASGWALALLHDGLFGNALAHWVEHGLAMFGFDGVLGMLVPIIYVFILLTLAFLSALLIVVSVAMPTVVRHVSARHYPDLELLHGGSRWVGVLNSIWVSAVFVVGWCLTMPLWLLLPLAVLLPMVWSAWLIARIMRYDALMEHASTIERKTLFRNHRASWLMLGVVIAALNYVPFLIFVTPIFGSLVFTHYALHELRQLRLRQGAALAAMAPRHDEEPIEDEEFARLTRDDPRTGPPMPRVSRISRISRPASELDAPADPSPKSPSS